MNTCWDCQRSVKFYGFGGSWDEPPEEPEATCTDDESEELYMEKGEEAAPVCPRFLPYPAGPCGNPDCAVVFYLPHALAPHFVSSPSGDIPVCSVRCAALVEALVAKEIDDETLFTPFTHAIRE